MPVPAVCSRSPSELLGPDLSSAAGCWRSEHAAAAQSRSAPSADRLDPAPFCRFCADCFARAPTHTPGGGWSASRVLSQLAVLADAVARRRGACHGGIKSWGAPTRRNTEVLCLCPPKWPFDHAVHPSSTDGPMSLSSLNDYTAGAVSKAAKDLSFPSSPPFAAQVRTHLLPRPPLARRSRSLGAGTRRSGLAARLGAARLGAAVLLGATATGRLRTGRLRAALLLLGAAGGQLGRRALAGDGEALGGAGERGAGGRLDSGGVAGGLRFHDVCGADTPRYDPRATPAASPPPRPSCWPRAPQCRAGGWWGPCCRQRAPWGRPGGRGRRRAAATPHRAAATRSAAGPAGGGAVRGGVWGLRGLFRRALEA